MSNDPVILNIYHEESGESREVNIPISEQVAAWKKANPGDLKVEDLYKFLEKLFSNPKRQLSSPNIVGYIREDGTEMIRFEGPRIWGGAMSLADWNKMVYEEMSAFVTQSSNFVKE